MARRRLRVASVRTGRPRGVPTGRVPEDGDNKFGFAAPECKPPLRTRSCELRDAAQPNLSSRSQRLILIVRSLLDSKLAPEGRLALDFFVRVNAAVIVQLVVVERVRAVHRQGLHAIGVGRVVVKRVTRRTPLLLLLSGTLTGREMLVLLAVVQGRGRSGLTVTVRRRRRVAVIERVRVAALLRSRAPWLVRRRVARHAALRKWNGR